MERSQSVEEFAEQLIDQGPSDTCPAGVYVIFDGNTGEPLYVGESKNVYQRLFDHHMELQSGSNTVREHVNVDPELDRDTAQGAMWEWTQWAWIALPEDRTHRKEVERAVEAELEPRYASR